MKEQTVDSQTWKYWENQGDQRWEEAFTKKTVEEMQACRQQAEENYERAYRTLMAESSRPLDEARLSRKRARCYRKLDPNSKRSRAALDEASSLLERLPEDDAEAQIQKAKVGLENATLDLMGNRPAEVRERTEAIIALCLEPPVQGREESWHILGEAYNLLGIVLDWRDDLESCRCTCPDECWDAAMTNYSIAGGELGERGVRDVTVQRALRLQRLGSHTDALSLLESVRDDLTPEREFVVDNNMIDAYLEMGDPNTALVRARDLFEQIAQGDDVVGQILARELLLKALCAMIPISSTTEATKYYESAKDIYYQGLKSLRQVRSRETEPDRIELHRIVIEICLEAGELEEAERILNDAWGEIGLPPLDTDPILDEERADWEVTIGRIELERGNLESALDHLDRAFPFFRAKEHRRVIRTGLVKLNVLSQKGDLGAAREILYELEGLASGMERTVDVQKVEEWKQQIGRGFSYERGLSTLAQQLKGAEAAVVSQFGTLEARLRENLDRTRSYGDSENRRTARSEILHRLNEFALEHLAISFNDLCLSNEEDRP